VTALLLLKRFWPFLVGAAVVIGAILWHNSKVSDAYDAGYDKATQESIEAAAAATKAMQDDWVAAHTADASRQTANAGKFRPLKERAANAPHDPACLDAGTRQLLDEAVRAANDTAPARKG
jgi:hypothetical protein